MKKNILLLHGWDYDAYSKRTNDKYVWDYCDELIESLKEKFNVYMLNFPGFALEKEPKEKEWDVEDFASFVNDYVVKNNLDIDIILGYSFGGAVAILYKNIYKSKAKLFLLAPAIIRNHDKSKKFVKTPKIIDGLRKFLRNIYVIFVVGNEEMKYGTKFLRNTYQIIVRRDLRDELKKINPNDLMLIYGGKDTAVDPISINNSLEVKYQKRIKMINGADHDNIVTDYVGVLINELDKYIV